jgi:ribosomal protein S18 acetylase RimI-like enzyme
MEVVVRTARPDDAADALLYESAAPYYTAYAGGPERARRLLRTLYPRDGHTASWEVCRVAGADGAIVGVLAAFPSRDGDALARRFVRLTLLHSAPWRVPRLMRHLRATAAVAPRPPERMLYVDALATDHAHRRRGVARTLLEEAERMAAAAGLDGVALDTGIENRAARSLYERAGFSPSSLRPAPDERIARAVGGSGFVGYVKPR